MSNRLPSSHVVENAVTAVVISISAFGLGCGFGGRVFAAGAESLSFFFLPNSPPNPFITADDSSELGEVSVCDGGGFDACELAAPPLCDPEVTVCPSAVAESVMLTYES